MSTSILTKFKDIIKRYIICRLKLIIIVPALYNEVSYKEIVDWGNE